jgi:multicomponent K+:H+ antiporter subunit G
MSDMHSFADPVVAGLILLGGAFALIGSWGLVRLPSLMSRLHGPTKATTLGVGSCLIASMIYFPTQGHAWTAHELLIALFLFITAPISANMIAKAYLHVCGTKRGEGFRSVEELPEAPAPHAGWATFGVAHDAESKTGAKIE